MKNKYAYAAFEKMSKELTPYEITFLDKQLTIFPGVFSPKYVTDVAWFAKEIPLIVGHRSFLEIGTGCGAIALFAGLNGATHIVTTDINPNAVENAIQTFKAHGVSASVRHGNVFEPIRFDEKFDVIFWNHPFHYSSEEITDPLLHGGFDHRYKSLRAFFAGAKDHLTANGEVLLATSENARLDLIKRMALTYGYRGELLMNDKIPSAHRESVYMDVRIYSFRPKVERMC